MRTDPHDLIDGYVNGDLSDAESKALEKWLAETPDAPAEFVRAMMMQRHLADMSVTPSLRVQQTELRPMTPRRMPTPSSQGRTIYAVAAALALAAAVVVIYLLAASPAPVDDDPQPTAPLATLIESTGVVSYEDGIAREGGEYAAGQYSIDSGSAQFLLTSRVTVDLRGRTRLRMNSPRSVYLAQGDASFNVPDGAEGFTVHLPDQSKIVDLGTAFRVTVGDDGRPELHVSVGEVLWTSADPEVKPVSIVAGQSATLIDGRPVPLRVVRLLGVDFQHNASASSGVTQPGFEAFDPTHANDGATYATDAGDISVAMNGRSEGLGGLFTRGGLVNGDELTYADLYNDFAFNNEDSSMTLSLSGPGIAAGADYDLTFYAYDPGDGGKASGHGQTQGVTMAGVDGTRGEAGPITYTVGEHPVGDDQYATTATFTADEAGRLTIRITDVIDDGRARVRVNAFEVSRHVSDEPEHAVDDAESTRPVTPASETADR